MMPHGVRLLLPLLLLAVAGCAYERVDIIAGGETYDGTILSHYTDVEATSRGLLLKPGARFAVKATGLTQFLAQYDVAILGGEGMNVYLRTVAHQFDSTKGMAFHYAVDGCTMREADGTIVPLNFNAEVEQQTLSFYNEANQLAVSVGCKRVYEQHTPLPETEYVIFETLPGSTVELRSVAYFETDVE